MNDDNHESLCFCFVLFCFTRLWLNLSPLYTEPTVVFFFPKVIKSEEEVLKEVPTMDEEAEGKQEGSVSIHQSPPADQGLFKLFPNLHKIKSSYSSQCSEPERDGKGSRTILTPFPMVSLGEKHMLSHLPLISRLVFLDYQYQDESCFLQPIELPSLWETLFLLSLQIHIGRILKSWRV